MAERQEKRQALGGTESAARNAGGPTLRNGHIGPVKTFSKYHQADNSRLLTGTLRLFAPSVDLEATLQLKPCRRRRGTAPCCCARHILRLRNAFLRYTGLRFRRIVHDDRLGDNWLRTDHSNLHVASSAQVACGSDSSRNLQFGHLRCFREAPPVPETSAFRVWVCFGYECLDFHIEPLL